jgi:hypothetical protein
MRDEKMQDTRYWIQDTGCKMQDARYWIQDTGCKMQEKDCELRILKTEIRGQRSEKIVRRKKKDGER